MLVSIEQVDNCFCFPLIQQGNLKREKDVKFWAVQRSPCNVIYLACGALFKKILPCAKYCNISWPTAEVQVSNQYPLSPSNLIPSQFVGGKLVHSKLESILRTKSYFKKWMYPMVLKAYSHLVAVFKRPHISITQNEHWRKTTNENYSGKRCHSRVS